MKWLPLIWAGVWRKPLRATLSLLSVVVAFLILGIMSGVNAQFIKRIDTQRLDRILVTPRFGMTLPSAYVSQISMLPGVSHACAISGIGGTFQDPRNGLGILMTHQCILDVDPEFKIADDEFRKLTEVRNGIIISRTTADRLHWGIGHTYPLNTSITGPDGTKTWMFKVIAVAPDNQLFFGGYALGNYSYLDNGRADGQQGRIYSVVVRVADRRNTQTIADGIEAFYLNSDTPVNATPERAGMISQLQGFLDIKFDTFAVSAAAMFMIIFLTANVMMQSAHERICELAVMKAFGWSDGAIFALVISEAVVFYLVGGALGLALSKLSPLISHAVIGGNAQVIGIGFLTPLITPGVFAVGLTLSILVAVASGLPAAWQLKRLPVASALSIHP